MPRVAFRGLAHALPQVIRNGKFGVAHLLGQPRIPVLAAQSNVGLNPRIADRPRSAQRICDANTLLGDYLTRPKGSTGAQQFSVLFWPRSVLWNLCNTTSL